MVEEDEEPMMRTRMKIRIVVSSVALLDRYGGDIINASSTQSVGGSRCDSNSGIFTVFHTYFCGGCLSPQSVGRMYVYIYMYPQYRLTNIPYLGRAPGAH